MRTKIIEKKRRKGIERAWGVYEKEKGVGAGKKNEKKKDRKKETNKQTNKE